jgi:hypothetical protein
MNDSFQVPNMIRNARFHCRGDSGGLIDVRNSHEMERNGSQLVFENKLRQHQKAGIRADVRIQIRRRFWRNGVLA